MTFDHVVQRLRRDLAANPAFSLAPAPPVAGPLEAAPMTEAQRQAALDDLLVAWKARQARDEILEEILPTEAELAWARMTALEQHEPAG